MHQVDADLVVVTQWKSACGDFELAEFELLDAAAEVDFLNCCADHLGRPHLPSSTGQEEADDWATRGASSGRR